MEAFESFYKQLTVGIKRPISVLEKDNNNNTSAFCLRVLPPKLEVPAIKKPCLNEENEENNKLQGFILNNFYLL